MHAWSVNETLKTGSQNGTPKPGRNARDARRVPAMIWNTHQRVRSLESLCYGRTACNSSLNLEAEGRLSLPTYGAGPDGYLRNGKWFGGLTNEAETLVQFCRRVEVQIRPTLLEISTKEIRHQQDHGVHLGKKPNGEEGNENDTHAWPCCHLKCNYTPSSCCALLLVAQPIS